MITSNIGRKFLAAYNKKYDKDYDAKTFFTEIFHPLFFGSSRYLMWIQNSPFVQLQGRKVETLTETDRAEKLEDLHVKIDSGYKDGSVAVGYPASDKKEFATTSGQVSNIDMAISKDDIYLSWIGAGLGIGVQGGLCILFDHTDMLLDIYEGWSVYRKMLDENNKLKGHHVNSWNGQWLVHRYSENFNRQSPRNNFDPPLPGKDGLQDIETLSWTRILVAFAQCHDVAQLTGYVYKLDKINITIGFIPFNLKDICRPVDLYKQIFGIASKAQAEPLWGTAMGFRLACQFGSIGGRAMEPSGFKNYMTEAKMPRYGKDRQQQINFNVYKIWIMAMLNNEELWTKSDELAKTLDRYASCSERGKTVNTNKVKTVLAAVNKNTFIKSLTEIVEDAQDTDKETIKDMAKLVNQMPVDNVPYFLTLVRFNYAAI